MPSKPLPQVTLFGVNFLLTKAGHCSFRPALLCTFLFVMLGCTTITRGSAELFRIESVPSGALIRASTGWTCISPCERKINRRSSFSLDFEKQGFKTARVLVRAEIDGAGSTGLAGNIIFGGLIGAAIDGGTGAMYSHPVNPLVVQLEIIE